ncbi:DNA repair protein RadC [Alteromonas lipolytica]
MKAWPVMERPREKLLYRGVNSLSDAELLAVLLGTGQKGKCVLTLARAILDEMGSLSAIVTASEQDFTGLAGVGRTRYAQLQAAFEIIRRHLEAPLKRGNVINGAEDARQFLRAQLQDCREEKFGMMLLDSQHQLIAFRVMFTGTINSAVVYPRELIRQVIADNAAAVILTHNHPSGVAEPSDADIRLTRDIVAAMGLIDVGVLDHIIVGATTTVSLAQRGLLS